MHTGEKNMERLDKLLAATGRWSRREVKDLVRQGRVELDGQPAGWMAKPCLTAALPI